MRILAAAVLASTVAAAQTANVEVDPITCWWRSTANAVRAGETFTVILTCSVLQTEAARVIADESRLDPTVVQLPPFEVLGGTHAKDIITAGRRFFQYEYQVRVIAENVFASTATLPALEISYKVESRVETGESVAGRDQTYALPALAVRVLSVVPDTATDIREAPVATFTELEDIAFRGTLLRVVAWVLLALGGLMLALALVGLMRRRAVDSPRSRLLPDAMILQGVRRELVAIRDQTRGGWTSDLAGRALAALRIVAAYALGHPVTQQVRKRRAPKVSDGRATKVPERRATTSVVARAKDRADEVVAGDGDGQLMIDGRFGTSAMVSATVTAEHAQDELREALARFAAARYGRDGTFDAKLDDGLETGIRTVDRLIARRPALERLWPR
jgi:hypothetical protein